MQAARPTESAGNENGHDLAARAELQRILLSPAFRGSRRCCRFLEYSIQHVLQGNAQQDLRERNIGIEVFQRAPDYDTAEDAIVRVTANEVRKRLAQFYQESGSDANPVITLPTGSYAACFRWKPVAVEPAAAGLHVICRGLRRTSPNDQAAIERGMLIYDALYAELAAGGT